MNQGRRPCRQTPEKFGTAAMVGTSSRVAGIAGRPDARLTAAAKVTKRRKFHRTFMASSHGIVRLFCLALLSAAGKLIQTPDLRTRFVPVVLACYVVHGGLPCGLLTHPANAVTN